MAKWLSWGCPPCQPPDAAPDLGFIEPLLRRRLSPLARAALHVANACARDCPDAQFVYASRHGELDRTAELLGNLARGEALSPTTFSLSVLNSAAGVFAIARGDTAPATAVAAGTETFGFGLLEAYARFRRNPAQPVLYVYADAAAPAPFGPLPGDPPQPLAVALLVDATAATILEMTLEAGDGEVSAQPQALSCLDALDGAPSSWSSGPRQWRWQRQ